MRDLVVPRHDLKSKSKQSSRRILQVVLGQKRQRIEPCCSKGPGMLIHILYPYTLGQRKNKRTNQMINSKPTRNTSEMFVFLRLDIKNPPVSPCQPVTRLRPGTASSSSCPRTPVASSRRCCSNPAPSWVERFSSAPTAVLDSRADDSYFLGSAKDLGHK